MHCWTFLNKITQPGGLLQWQSHDFNHIGASSFLRIHCKFHVTLPKKKKKKKTQPVWFILLSAFVFLFFWKNLHSSSLRNELLGAKPLHFITSTVAISSRTFSSVIETEAFLFLLRLYFFISGMSLNSSHFSFNHHHQPRLVSHRLSIQHHSVISLTTDFTCWVHFFETMSDNS